MGFTKETGKLAGAKSKRTVPTVQSIINKAVDLKKFERELEELGGMEYINFILTKSQLKI